MAEDGDGEDRRRRRIEENKNIFSYINDNNIIEQNMGIRHGTELFDLFASVRDQFPQYYGMEIIDYLKSIYPKSEERVLQILRSNPRDLTSNDWAAARFCLEKGYNQCLQLIFPNQNKFFDFCLNRIFNIGGGAYGSFGSILKKMQQELRSNTENDVSILLNRVRLFGIKYWLDFLYGNMFFYGMIRSQNREYINQVEVTMRYEIMEIDFNKNYYPEEKSTIYELKRANNIKFLKLIIDYPVPKITASMDEESAPRILTPIENFIDLPAAEDFFRKIYAYAKTK
jgi:hypothetical protein